MCTVLDDTIGIMKKRKSDHLTDGRRYFNSNPTRLRLHDNRVNRFDYSGSDLFRDVTKMVIVRRPRRTEIKRDLPQRSNLGFTRSLHAGMMDTIDLRRAMVCAKRKVRKEVIHALGKAGSGKKRPPRYTQESMVQC